MHLELNEAEAHELRQTLDLRLKDLERELVKTDDREYRVGLRQTMAVIENVLSRLGHPESSAEAYDGA